MKSLNLSTVTLSTKPLSSEEIQNLSATELIKQFLIAKQVLKLQKKDGKSPRMIQKWEKNIENLKIEALANSEKIEIAIKKMHFSEEQKSEKEKFQEFVEMFEKSKKSVTVG